MLVFISRIVKSYQDQLERNGIDGYYESMDVTAWMQLKTIMEAGYRLKPEHQKMFAELIQKRHVRIAIVIRELDNFEYFYNTEARSLDISLAKTVWMEPSDEEWPEIFEEARTFYMNWVLNFIEEEWRKEK